jgi:hypothetical protein
LTDEPGGAPHARGVATRSRLLARDIVVVAGFTALGLVELDLVRPRGWPYGVVIVLLVGALLVWRRRYPLVISTSAVLIQLLMPWIAPELHDVIAHLVGAMAEQTAAAQDLVQTDPERAGGVLAEAARPAVERWRRPAACCK